MLSRGRDRLVATYILLNVDLNAPAPVILSFHGNNKSMDYQAKLSRLTEPDINNDTIAVFPEGLAAGDPFPPEKCWEGAPYCNTGVSDKAFITDLPAYMQNNFCIDIDRVYAFGKSIGGGFVDVLACSRRHDGDFAACAPAKALTPILELHGTEDTIAKYDGGISHGTNTPSIRKVLSTWATRNGCGPSPVPAIDELQSNGVYYTQYDCRGRESLVVGYNVTGQGHTWTSTMPNDENKGNTAPIDATTIMMEFFRANPRPPVVVPTGVGQ
ncbi:hypothetical protein H2200_010453 [Cladophialophora chaetospira]|uniref:feruloyl esterase n=1 Tax=Cladophialophora chaetospira TaxID=386627 RepID=A0AA39CE85_9EURO|nr:hypothetical protein H2200_010453 [Cladophialophora chaetospira]